MRAKSKLKKKIIEDVLDNAAIGHSIINPKMEIVWLNRTFKRWFPKIDVKRRPLCYKYFYSPPRKKICPYCPVIKTFKTGQIHSSETDTCADGRIYNLFSLPLRDKNGKIIYAIETVEDITRRKQLEKKLKAANAFLQSIINGVNEPIMVIGEDYRVKLMNKAAQKFSFGKAKATEPLFCYQVSHRRKTPCIGTEHPCPLEELRKTGQPVKVLHKHFQAKVGQRLFEIAASPLWKEDGTFQGIVESLHDITARQQAEEALRQSEEKYRGIFERVPISIVLFDKDGRIVDINPWHISHIGKGKTTQEDYIGKNVVTYPSIVKAGLSQTYAKLLKKGEPFEIADVYFPTTSGGVDAYLNVKGVPLFSDGEVIGGIAIHEDITARKRDEEAYKESELEYQTLINNVNIGVYRNTLGPEGRFLKANPAIAKMFAYDSPEEFMENKVSQLYDDPRDRTRFIEKIKKTGSIKDEEVKLRKKDGSRIWGSVTAKIYFDINGQPKWIDGVIEDITERKKAEAELGQLNKELLKSNKRLKQLVLHDPHTGLYNHRYLQDVIEAEFHRAKRYAHPFSVMMMDVDYFKSINDVYGHIFGDLVLKQLARQLKRMVRQYDIVIRFGGEEFVIISPGIDRPGALKLAQRLLDAVNLYNFGDKNHTVKLKLSIAVASYPEDKIIKGIDLVEITDQILNKIKEYGGNNVYSSLDIKKKIPSLSRKPKVDIGLLKDKIEKLTKRTNQSLIEAVFAFAKTIELKDQCTGEHVEKTVLYATEIARALNLPGEEIERIKQAAILHDLGKIGISEKILVKKSKLTKEEFEEIKKHPQIGVDIIRPIKFLHNIIPLMLYHHERWDGKGYPNGLKEEEIPIGARVLAIADVYQALASNRPYRKAYSEEEACKIMKSGSGTQFDPVVVTKFMQVMQERKQIK
ncbi:MAG: diguanylate cyclase [Candidatus Omnitrophota bacterium]|nr:diguanylate cyclase [Candidatus Omnitrophota bacterium]